MQTIVEINNVTFRYSSDGATVLRDVSLGIERGQFVAIIGANGSGKTTLAKHMNAILLPTEGSVIVDGMDTADEANLFDIRRRVGMVFQNPDNQIVASLVEEDIAFAPENLGLPREEIRARVDEALETVGMYDHKDESPHKLSGGQKQRVAIAGVLAMRPDCIVLDEPTAMLDPKGRARVMRTVHELNKEHGMTVVLITHFMEDAARADRVIAMHAGQIVCDDTPERVFSDRARMQKLELDVPPAAVLCALLRKGGLALPGGIVTPEACAAALIPLLEGAK